VKRGLTSWAGTVVVVAAAAAAVTSSWWNPADDKCPPTHSSQHHCHTPACHPVSSWFAAKALVSEFSRSRLSSSQLAHLPHQMVTGCLSRMQRPGTACNDNRSNSRNWIVTHCAKSIGVGDGGGGGHVPPLKFGKNIFRAIIM